MRKQTFSYFLKKAKEVIRTGLSNASIVESGGELASFGPYSRATGRFFHGDTRIGRLEIFINGLKMVDGLTFKKLSQIVTLPEGRCQLDVYCEENWIGSEVAFIEHDKHYFIAGSGCGNETKILICPFDIKVPPGEAAVRFVHLAPSLQPVDISVHKGDVVFPEFPYHDVTPVLMLSPFRFNLEARLAGTKTVALPMHDCFFEANESYLICIIEDQTTESRLDYIFIKQ